MPYYHKSHNAYYQFNQTYKRVKVVRRIYSLYDIYNIKIRKEACRIYRTKNFTQIKVYIIDSIINNRKINLPDF